jgi:uncharacterized protein (TIGR00288 family)
MMDHEKCTRNIAVLVDCENLCLRDFDIDLILRWASQLGRVSIKRAYGDWSNFPQLKNAMLFSAVELVEMAGDARGKNRADIRIVVDAMEIALQRDHIDTFVIASGDSDFVPLLNRLREYGRHTIMLARRESHSQFLLAACDQVVFSDEIQAAFPDRQQSLQRAGELLRESIAALETENQPLEITHVKKRMGELDPTFSHMRFGFKNFKSMLAAVDPESLARLQIGTDRTAKKVESPNGQQVRTSSSRKRPANDLVPELSATLLDHIHWAVELLKQSDEDFRRADLIQNCLHCLFPKFRLRSFGFSKSAGFRKVFTLMELERWCDLMPASKKSTSRFDIHFADRYFERIVVMPKPSEFDEKLRRRKRFTSMPGPTIPNPYPVPSFANAKTAASKNGLASPAEASINNSDPTSGDSQTTAIDESDVEVATNPQPEATRENVPSGLVERFLFAELASERDDQNPSDGKESPTIIDENVVNP